MFNTYSQTRVGPPFVLLVALAAGCAPDLDIDHAVIESGEAAKEIITSRNSNLPADSLSNYYYFQVAGLDGQETYIAFDYADEAACWKAVAEFYRFAPRNHFSPFTPSELRILRLGPGCHGKRYSSPLWDTSQIRRGLVWEMRQEDRNLSYCAIDLERQRIYLVNWTGGYPTN